MPPIASTPSQTIIAWSEKARSRTWAATQPTKAAIRIANPPIVGVPSFGLCQSGPMSIASPRIG